MNLNLVNNMHLVQEIPNLLEVVLQSSATVVKTIDIHICSLPEM
jgi:hypothetical protein